MLFVQLLEDLSERGELGEEWERERARDPENLYLPFITEQSCWWMLGGGTDEEGALQTKGTQVSRTL